MIKIVKKEIPTTKQNEPYYRLVYNYMIGDADGDTEYEVEVSVDNPYLERYFTLINQLDEYPGVWGVVFDGIEHLGKHWDAEQITEDDYGFLLRMMYEEDSEFEVPAENEAFAGEFRYGVRGETEYSFLVFQGCDLYYVDEFGEEHATGIE